ncbi:hypothetical protein NDU88_000765 [Pleurodeles waltl]|uniref:Uncharacterized protein n=1 Tax=Pleurodeles waltl TaxID=8319 RepID=A0AAV7SAZ3_PLEWA|nr:hypothetical protein NDU88_000765 [Pleurodeles waltl]
MQLDISMKKEVARWYWLLLDIVGGEFNLPEEIWRDCLPEAQLKDLWQVSTTLLYNTVKPAASLRVLWARARSPVGCLCGSIPDSASSRRNGRRAHSRSVSPAQSTQGEGLSVLPRLGSTQLCP